MRMANKVKPVCEWVEDAGCYVTDCKEEFVMNDDSANPGEWIKFCCFCGKPARFEPEAP